MPVASPGSRFGTFAVRLSVLAVLAAVGLVSASAPASAQACIAGTDSDFDGDGVADLAIGDPDATVDGQGHAGRVHLAYGDGARVTIDAGDIPDNDNGAGERFGFAMASTDWNGDGCSDLFVGAPFENWSNNTEAEAGLVIYIPGSPSGLDASLAQNWSEDKDLSWAAEAGDRFGYSLAAGVSAAGDPFVVAGAPGEAIGDLAAAGGVVYFRPGESYGYHQDTEGVFGNSEAGDLFGYAVAASPTGFAVGGPGEAVDAFGYAGTVAVFEHGATGSAPIPIGGADQESDGVSGYGESGDMMGYSLAMVDYLPAGASDPVMLLAVGAVGEDGSDGTIDSGWVVEFTADSAFTQRRTFSQAAIDTAGGRETGEMLGASLAMVNRAPGETGTWEDVLVVAGSPGEDDEAAGLGGRGAVQVLSALDHPADHDVTVDAALSASGYAAGAGSALGATTLATPTHLVVTDSRAEAPAVYVIPWDDILAGGTDSVVAYTPADFGVSDDAGSFGASLA